MTPDFLVSKETRRGVLKGCFGLFCYCFPLVARAGLEYSHPVHFRIVLSSSIRAMRLEMLPALRSEVLDRGTPVDELVSEIARASRCYLIESSHDEEVVLNLNKVFRDEFNRGMVVRLEGWTLSQTEYKVMSFLSRFSSQAEFADVLTLIRD